MKKIIYLTLFLVFFNFLSYSQNREVKIFWSVPKFILTNEGREKQVLFFEGAKFSNEYPTLPQFEIVLSQSGITDFKIIDPVYVPLSEDEEKLLPDNFNNKNPTVTTEIKYQNKQAITYVKILPFRFNVETRRIEKIISFKYSFSFSSVSKTERNNSSRTNYRVANENKSVLAEGDWYKLALQSDGIYKLDYNFLSSLGLNLNSINPKNIRLYGNGGGMLPQANSAFRYKDIVENPIYIKGEEDGVFNKEDYILFYGKGPDTWYFDSIESIFRHKKNIYSDNAYYFLTVGSSEGIRIADQPNIPSSGAQAIVSYNEHLVYEQDLVNVLSSGREWFGEPFDFNLSRNFNFDISSRIPTSDLKITSSVMGRSSQTTNFSVTANGVSLGRQYFDQFDNDTYAAKGDLDTEVFNLPSNEIGNTPTLLINLTYQKAASASIGFLNYLEINFEKELKFNGSQMFFRNASSRLTPSSTFELNQVNSDIKIWNVSRVEAISNHLYSKNGSQVSFSYNPESSIKEFIAFSGNSFPNPKFIGKVSNQNLHEINAPNLPDMVIVTPEQFSSQAQRLADFRKSNDKLDVIVVSTEKIYNEFSSGSPDISAIRDFMKMLYDSGTQSDSIRYLLLFGDASFDYKDRTDKNTNFVPIYESIESLHPVNTYSSDDYFGFLDDDEGLWTENYSGNDLLDIGIGRLVIKNIEEAEQVVNKIIHYNGNKESLGKWRNKITFMADDGDYNLHMDGAETLTQIVESKESAYNINKIYIDAFPQASAPGGEVTPVGKQMLNEAIDKGTLILNYTGHGGESVLAQEQIVELSQVGNWTNYNKLFFFVTATCVFGRYDDPKIVSGGETCLLNPKGGAIGLLTSTRPVYSSSNLQLNSAFYNCLFQKINGDMPRLGDVIRITKNNSLSGVNNRNYALLGDPSMRLEYPEKDVVITSVNDSTVAAVNDTIKALSKVTLKGEMRDNGNLINNFQGKVYATVYDKEATISTAGSHEARVANFKLRNNFIFEGIASVKDGKFAITFIAPKDISYSFDFGKISLYAREDSSSLDAKGEYSNLIIGGSEKNTSVDNTPPVIKLYMNDESFKSGGLTNPNNRLLAKISDESGINVSSTGIGHEITARLDGNKEVLVLNEFYSSENDNYKKGVVTYPFNNLSQGRHTLTFKAWDNYNNSTETSIEFFVSDKEGLSLQNVLNYPNPFSDFTNLQFEHNRAGDDLSVSVNIFSITGKHVITIDRQYQSSDSRIFDIVLDRTGLNPGMYIFSVNVKSLVDNSEDTKQGKFIISE